MTGATTMERTLDADGHEMTPNHLWGEIFGEAAARISEQVVERLKRFGDNDIYNPSVAGDETEINQDTIWNIRGTKAPGAFDFRRRLEVMDAMGIEKQLVFPSYGLLPAKFLVATEYTLRDHWGLTDPLPEIRQLGRTGLDEYNDWVIRTTASAPDRLRCVAYLTATVTPEELLAEAQDLIARGALALNIAPGTPPGGVSPAADEMDPFWALLEEHDVPLLLHIGNESGMFASGEWGRAPAFKPGKVESHEIGLEPYSVANLHLPAQHYLSILVLGGVFERFPRLRFGVIETGSGWLAPLARHLDMWARDVFSVRLRPFISMLPSEYIARNVRVTPFNNFEPVEQQLAANPDLHTCYCYSTDYPHVEGGKNIKRVFEERVSPLGPDVMEKFFVTNAEWLLPDR